MAGYLTAKAHRVGAGGGVAFHPAAGFSGRRQHPRQGDRCIVAGTVEHGMGPGGEVAVSAQLDQECATAATTTAPPAGTRLSRVAMLPRSSTNSRSGRSAESWARRRCEPVATVAPGAKSVRAAPTNASRASPRPGTAASLRPSIVTAGRSLAEWTARSARPSSTAACTSFANTPLRRDRHVEAPISLGVDRHHLHVDSGPGRGQQAGHVGGLPQGERAGPGGDPQHRDVRHRGQSRS